MGKKGELSGVAIRKFREGFDWSQEDLAGLLGIGRATLAKWENERQTPSGSAVILLTTLMAACLGPEAVASIDPTGLAGGWQLFRVMRAMLGLHETWGWSSGRSLWSIPLGVEGLLKADGLSADAIIVDGTEDGLRPEGGVSVKAGECEPVAKLGKKILPEGRVLVLIVPRARHESVGRVLLKHLKPVVTMDGYLGEQVSARLLVFSKGDPASAVEAFSDLHEIRLDTTEDLDALIECATQPGESLLLIGTSPVLPHNAITLGRRVLLAAQDPIKLAELEDAVDTMVFDDGL